MIDPERDLYAIPSQDGGEIYFLSLVDILTHYGEWYLFIFSVVAFWNAIMYSFSIIDQKVTAFIYVLVASEAQIFAGFSIHLV